MSFFRQKKIYVGILSILIISFLFLYGIRATSAKADNPKPNLTITYTGTNKTTGVDVLGKVNEEIKINYMVTPSDLDVSDINPITNKEIVLVLDTSGSMNDPISTTDRTTRISALKDAANNFINILSTQSNVKIGIVTYSSQKNQLIGLTQSNQSSTLTSKINGLTPNGSTNIGDGIRGALAMLNNGSNAKKYVVLMSDGEPTQYTYYTTRVWVQDGWWPHYEYQYPYYTSLTNNGSQQYDGGGNSDPDGKSLEYASIMADIIKANNYSSFEIAYSSGSSADKMKALKDRAGGKFYSALDKDTIKNVYADIADQIAADYLVEGVKFKFTLPQDIQYSGSMADITINGTTYTQQLANISYTLNANKTKYTAQPFPISFTFKANKSGNYNNIGQGWSLTYNDISGHQVTKDIPYINYTATSLDLGYTLMKNIPGDPSKIDVGIDTTLNYSINPSDIAITSRRKARQVVLLVDSKYSQKDNIKSFLNKFSGVSDVTFALIIYGSGANVSNFGTSDVPNYFVSASNSTLTGSINEISTSGGSIPGSNLGDGLRKALYVLNNKSDVGRSIVVFGENNPDYYTYTKAEDGSISYYNELDNLSGSTTESTGGALIYGSDSVKAKEYAESMASKIVASKALSISILTAGDDSQDDVIKNISSNIAFTEFCKITSDDDLSRLKNVVNSDLIINGYINESLPQGIMFNTGGQTFRKDVKIFYNYNNSTGKYVGIPVSATTLFKGMVKGDYVLGSSKFYYYDLEGTSLNKDFPSLKISALSSTFIKQGVFQQNGDSNSSLGLGEKYVNSTASQIALRNNVIAAALVRSNLNHIVATITINSSNNGAVSIGTLSNTNITNSVKLYVVDDNNNLSESHIGIAEVTDDGNKKILKFTIDTTDTGVKKYIISYKYNVLPSDGISDQQFYQQHQQPVTISTDCSLNDGTTGETFNYTIAGLPDLF